MARDCLVVGCVCSVHVGRRRVCVGDGKLEVARLAVFMSRDRASECEAEVTQHKTVANVSVIARRGDWGRNDGAT